jgi:hypothetical protein
MQRHKDDQSYYGADSAWWSCIETNVAIICASLPALRKLVSSIWPSLLGSSKSYGSGRQSGSKFSNSHSSGSRSRKEFVELGAQHQGSQTTDKTTDVKGRSWLNTSQQSATASFNDRDSSYYNGDGIQITRDVAWDGNSEEGIVRHQEHERPKDFVV